MLTFGRDQNYIRKNTPLASTTGPFEEGMFMVATLEDTMVKATVSLGVPGEKLLGVATGYFSNPCASWPMVEYPVARPASAFPNGGSGSGASGSGGSGSGGSGSAPANSKGCSVQLSRIPTATSTPLVWVCVEDPNNSTWMPGAPLKATHQGNIVTIPEGIEAGQRVVVQYSYDPTYTEVSSRVGNPVMPYPTMAAGHVSLLTLGTCWTSNYDTNCDWSQVMQGARITLGPNGMVTLNGEGTDITDQVSLAQIPVGQGTGQGESYLGLSINVT